MTRVPPRPCPRVRPLLDAYLSNELLVETSLEVFEHLSTCEACAGSLAAKAELRDRLREAVGRVEVPRGLGRIHWSQRAPRWLRSFFR